MQNKHYGFFTFATEENCSEAETKQESTPMNAHDCWHYCPKEGTLTKGETVLYNVSECKDGLMIGRNYFASGQLDLCGTVCSPTNEYAITAIGEYAFGKCKELVGISLPCTLHFIGSYAFEGCEGLRQVQHAGTTLPTMGNDPFKGCTALSKQNPLQTK